MTRWSFVVGLAFGIGVFGQSSDLHTAVKQGDLQRLSALATAGADLNAADRDGATPLHYAIFYDQSRLAAFLLEQRVDIHATWQGSTPLDVAIGRGNLDVVKSLLDRGVDLRRTLPTGRTALHLAALYNRTDIARLLIARGAPVNARDRQDVTPLNEAVLRGFYDFVQLLLEKGADPNNQNTRTGAAPLNEAIYKNQPGIVSLLLAAKANLAQKDSSGLSPLANAVRLNHAEAARLLVAHVGGPLGTADLRATLLEEAVGKGYRAMIAMLLEIGVDSNVRFPSGSGPLDLAARKGRVEVVELLLANKADVGMRDRSGSTPLHIAALSGNFGAAATLLRHGAAINSQESESGATPLFLAAFLGREDVVRLLLENGADPDICDKAGKSPLRAALAAENRAAAALITARGGHESCRTAAKR